MAHRILNNAYRWYQFFTIFSRDLKQVFMKTYWQNLSGFFFFKWLARQIQKIMSNLVRKKGLALTFTGPNEAWFRVLLEKISMGGPSGNKLSFGAAPLSRVWLPSGPPYRERFPRQPSGFFTVCPILLYYSCKQFKIGLILSVCEMSLTCCD